MDKAKPGAITRAEFDAYLEKVFAATSGWDKKIPIHTIVIEDGWVYCYNAKGAVMASMSEVTYNQMKLAGQITPS